MTYKYIDVFNNLMCLSQLYAKIVIKNLEAPSIIDILETALTSANNDTIKGLTIIVI